MIRSQAIWIHARTSNEYTVRFVGKVKILWWWFECVVYAPVDRSSGPWVRLKRNFLRSFYPRD